ncbi:hypothetical protein JZU46_06300 [bacterium]|nr:hypothetical protein [bacterium]
MKNTNIFKIICISLYVLLLVIISNDSSAADKSIHIEWGYTPPSSPAVIGFKLYQEGVPVCQVILSTSSAMDCFVSLTKKTTNFTLTALFSDATESPQSAQFPFTNDDVIPVVVTSGNTKFSFNWEAQNLANVKGYKVYMNNKLLCENTNSTDRTLSCTADSVTGTVTFNMTEIYTDNTESNYSNSIIYKN